MDPILDLHFTKATQVKNEKKMLTTKTQYVASHALKTLCYNGWSTSEVIHHVLTQSVESILYFKGLPFTKFL